jgi:hypothetical protein
MRSYRPLPRRATDREWRDALATALIVSGERQETIRTLRSAERGLGDVARRLSRLLGACAPSLESAPQPLQTRPSRFKGQLARPIQARTQAPAQTSTQLRSDRARAVRASRLAPRACAVQPDLIVLRRVGAGGLRNRRLQTLQKIRESTFVRVAALAGFLVLYGKFGPSLQVDASVSDPKLGNLSDAKRSRVQGATQVSDSTAPRAVQVQAVSALPPDRSYILRGRTCTTQTYVIGDRSIHVHKC